MVACSRCQFMNPVKQKACQACGAPLPYASAPNHERPGQARPTLRGLRSPEPVHQVSGGHLSQPSLPTPDKTMPSMVGPTPEQIRSHKINNTLLGHNVPTAEVSKSSPYSSPQPAVSPISPRPASTAQVSRTPVNQLPPRSNRQATLVGHPALDAARRGTAQQPASQHSAGGATEDRKDTSQTLPSMQAVTSEASTTTVTTDDTEEEPPGANETSVESHSFQRLTATDNPAKTYFAVTAARPSSESSPTSEPEPAFAGLGTPPPLPHLSPAPREGIADSLGPARSPDATRAPSSARSRSVKGPSTAPTSATPAKSEAVRAGPLASERGLAAPSSRVLSRRAIQSRLGKFVLGVTALLGSSLLIFTWVWRPPPPVSGSIDPHVTPATLQLQCDSCADGSFVSFDGRTAQFVNQRATIPLVEPPTVGPNSFVLDIHRTGIGRDERVTLAVNVEYRAVWDLSGLSAEPPILAIALDAAPNTGLKVNGVPVDLAGGRGHVPVVLSERFTVPSNAIEWLETSVQVTAGGAPTGGSRPFTLKVPVVPLAVDTPAPTFHTDSFTVTVSGRSLPGATISGAGHRVETDAQGYFELPVTARPGSNLIEVTASLANHVPRSVAATFTQTDNLTKLAVAYQTDATRRFDELTQRLAQNNAPLRVALAGRVQEWRTDHNVTVALLAVTSGCPNRTCLVRVEHPAALVLGSNRAVSVFGEATLSDSAGTPIPLIQSHFILE